VLNTLDFHAWKPAEFLALKLPLPGRFFARWFEGADRVASSGSEGGLSVRLGLV
jgi:hypothetical protein